MSEDGNLADKGGDHPSSAATPTDAAVSPKTPKGQKSGGIGKKIAVIGGAAAVSMLAFSVWLMSGKSQYDVGAGSPSTIKGSTPQARNDSMKEVGVTESDKRALVNKDKADDASQKGKGYVAQTVIVASKPAELGEMPDDGSKKKQEEKPPQVREVIKYIEVPVPVNQPPPIPTPDPVMVQRVNAQIEALLTPEKGGFVSRSFAKGERPQAAQTAHTTTGVSQGARPMMIARSGDVAMARLDRGFNSDDPAAPIFATIVDYDDYNRPGPLNNVRLMGRVNVNNNQASVDFDQMIWQNGQISPMKAIAITQTDARTGVATDVDRHLFMRYGGLLLAGLATGAGQVGQVLVQNNRTVDVQPNGGYIATGNKTNWGQVALGAMMPVGQTFTSVFLKNMNEPTTVSAPQGLTIGVVFLQPVLTPQTAQRR